MVNIKRCPVILLALLLLVCWVPAASAATGVSQDGRTIAVLGDNLFIALSDDNDFLLNVMPKDGGSLTKVDSQQNIDDLLAVDEDLFYIRFDEPSYQLVKTDGTGTALQPLLETEQVLEKLSYYNEVLYCLIDGVLTLVDPADGNSEPLNPNIKMIDYTIVNDNIFYLSAGETLPYTVKAGDEEITGNGHMLYLMDITGSNSEQLLDVGFSDLSAYGNYLYLHNMADSYATQAGDGNIWMEGRLYRMNIETHQLVSMSIPYDWSSYPTAYGMVVYSNQDVSLYPLSGGAAKKLYTPEAYTTVTASDTMAYVYEYTEGKLTALPLDGGPAKTLYNGGPLIDTDDGLDAKDTTPQYQLDDDGNLVLDENGDPIPVESDDSNASAELTETPDTGSSSSSGKTGGHIFPNSRTKKLTRAQILNVSKSKWGYGRNEIYARHGYRFNTKKYRDYFNGKSWYKAGGFSTKNLNSTEWYNMKLIRSMEVEYGLLDSDGRSTSSPSTSSGSGRIKLSKNVFPNSSTKKLTASQVKKLSKEKLATARNEILARHGYPFTQSKWQNYFKKIGWKKRSNYSSSKLNSIEWHNINLIKKYE